MKKLFLSLLSNAINAYLRLDPESKQRLSHLQGKVITIELLPFHFIFQLLLTDHGIKVQADEQLIAETTICGTPIQLFGMMINKDNRQRFFADDIKVEGNAELGQSVIELFDELHIDWEEYLSHLVGDVPAHHTGRFIRSVGQWFRRTEKTFTDDINEYVHEEAAWFPTSEALKDFFNEIDNARMDVDRIEARIMHLKGIITEREKE